MTSSRSRFISGYSEVRSFYPTRTMKVACSSLIVLIPLIFTAASASSPSSTNDFASACYNDLLPSIPPSTTNRTIPWGNPSVKNEPQTCCSSLDEVRAGIDMVDAQLLKLLAQRYFQRMRVSEFWKSWILFHRAAYVREATRFKATHDTVDVPARDQEVIDGAEANATAAHLPKTIAKAVFSAIINSSVPFEYCVVSSKVTFIFD